LDLSFVPSNTNPIGLRLGVNRTWDSIWYDEKHFAEKLHEDIIIRNYINKKLRDASISKINIERTAKNITITIFSSRPGIVIGKGGSEVESLKKSLNQLIGYETNINVSEIKRPALSACLVGQSIAQQLEKKINYRRSVKKSIQSTMSMGAEGIKIRVAGRLNGIDIARQETFKEGRIPLHTLRSNIDYAHVEALTPIIPYVVKASTCA
jgi:small subunit ribosomal protein S3